MGHSKTGCLQAGGKFAIQTIEVRPRSTVQDLDRVKDSILKLKAELAYAQETTAALRAVKQRVTEQALQRTRDALQAQESITKQQAESVWARAVPTRLASAGRGSCVNTWCQWVVSLLAVLRQCVPTCNLCACPDCQGTHQQLSVQIARVFLEVDDYLDPKVKAVAKERAQAHVAGVLAAVDVEKYIKVGASELI